MIATILVETIDVYNRTLGIPELEIAGYAVVLISIHRVYSDSTPMGDPKKASALVFYLIYCFSYIHHL